MPTRHVEDARARFARVSFAARLGVAVAELAHDRAVLVLPYQPDHMNAGGVLNGGASASLATMTGALAAWSSPVRCPSPGGLADPLAGVPSGLAVLPRFAYGRLLDASRAAGFSLPPTVRFTGCRLEGPGALDAADRCLQLGTLTRSQGGR